MFLRPMHRVKKRLFVVTALTLSAILLIGGVTAFYIASLPGPADMTRFVIEEGPSRQSVLGSGLSLSQLDTANWLVDASFEPYPFRTALEVQDADAQTLFVSIDAIHDSRHVEGFFDGAQARVLAWDEQGYELKKTSRVASFGINRVGSFQETNLPGDWPGQANILGFAQSDSLTLAAASRGMILHQAGSAAPEAVDLDLDADLTGISAYAEGFFVCSSQGDVLFSRDGMEFSSLKVPQTLSLNAITASDDGHFVAVGQNGRVVTGQASDPAASLVFEASSHLKTVAHGQGHFVAAGDDGAVYVSRGGLIWSRVEAPSVNWHEAMHHEGRFVLVGEDGMLGISDDGFRFDWVSTGHDEDFVDLVMLTREHFILLDARGQFHVTHDSGSELIASELETGMQSQVISLVDKDKLISADRQGQLGMAPLMAQVRLESSLHDGSFQAGDMLFLEKSYLEVPPSYAAAGAKEAWQAYGSGDVLRDTGDAAPGGGIAALRMDRRGLAAQDATLISQKLPQEAWSQAMQNEVMRVELWMRLQEAGPGKVQVWLSGLGEPQGTTYQHVGTSWRKYTHTFVWPKGQPLDESDVRLNVAYDGTGELFLDQLYLGPATDDESLATAGQTRLLQSIQPNTLRLDFLELGSAYSGQENWAKPLGNESYPVARDDAWRQEQAHSLHAGLQLAYEAKADPWLVLDSYMDENELIRLMEYLAGPLSKPYGKVRQQNGQIRPWTERFDRLYLEFTDRYNLFGLDRFRGDRVDHLMDAISRSPYYQQIKQQVVFIDGMTYEEGVMLSGADFHAGDFHLDLSGDAGPNGRQAFEDYHSQIPRVPEKTGQQMVSMIRSLSYEMDFASLPTMASITRYWLEDLGEQTVLALLDWPQTGDDAMPFQSAATLTSQAARGQRLAVEPLTWTEDGNEVLSEKEDPVMLAFGFMDEDQIAIVLLNPSEDRQDASLITDLPLQGADIVKYDAEGRPLDQQTFRQTTQTITLLPGGAALILAPLTPSD